jgi:hypothetical protein
MKTACIRPLVTCPEGETIVSMVVHRDRVYIATNIHVYRLDDENQLTPVATALMNPD